MEHPHANGGTPWVCTGIPSSFSIRDGTRFASSAGPPPPPSPLDMAMHRLALTLKYPRLLHHICGCRTWGTSRERGRCSARARRRHQGTVPRGRPGVCWSGNWGKYREPGNVPEARILSTLSPAPAYCLLNLWVLPENSIILSAVGLLRNLPPPIYSNVCLLQRHIRLRFLLTCLMPSNRSRLMYVPGNCSRRACGRTRRGSTWCASCRPGVS